MEPYNLIDSSIAESDRKSEIAQDPTRVPTLVRNQLALRTESEQAFYSPHPMVLNGLTTWSSTPIHLFPGRRKALGKASVITMSSAAPLGPDFARGWARLPAELKVRTLTFALASDLKQTTARSWERKLRPFLRMTPEIAELAREIFYKKTDFLVAASSQSMSAMVLLPKPPFHTMIRYMTFSLECYYPNSMIALADLVIGRCRFSKIRTFRIRMHTEFSPDRALFHALLGAVPKVVPSIYPLMMEILVPEEADRPTGVSRKYCVRKLQEKFMQKGIAED